MKLSKFIQILKSSLGEEDPNVEFVGMKWQDECHPSAKTYPIDLVDAKRTPDGRQITVKFITTKHNP